MPRTLANQLDLSWTEQKIFALLQDGLLHTREEILKCLREKYQTDDDGVPCYSTIQNHISRIRKKMDGRGLQLDCILSKRKIYYRLSRRLGNPRNGD